MSFKYSVPHAQVPQAMRTNGIYGQSHAVSLHEAHPQLQYDYRRGIGAGGVPNWNDVGALGATYDGVGAAVNNPVLLTDAYPGYSYGGGHRTGVTRFPSVGTTYSECGWITIAENLGGLNRVPFDFFCGGNQGHYWWIQKRAGTNDICLAIYNGVWNYVGQTTLTVNKPTHICATRSGNVHCFYVNGVLKGTITTGVVATGGGAWGNHFIGCLLSTPNPIYYWSGRVHDVSMYPWTLTPSAILRLYEQFRHRLGV